MTTSHLAGWTATRLAQAVVRGQLELHYQPIAGLHSDQIVGVEALLCWRHPMLGLLPPGQFLPVVESSDLMSGVGAWVLDATCCQMREWQKLAWQPFRLAVNVSTDQVRLGFDGWVKDMLADAESSAEPFGIELTGPVVFDNPTTLPTLGALQQIGAYFAADDFDTGYPCLQHLKCYPITTLKIDQSFVTGFVADHRNRTIVCSVVRLVHELGIDVVAGGMETPTSLTLLWQVEYDTGQGFLLAKSTPAAISVALVSQWRGATINASSLTAASCCVYCKGIPFDTAFAPEGVEYVERFYGLEHYQHSQARAKAENRIGADPNTCSSLPSDSSIPQPSVRSPGAEALE